MATLLKSSEVQQNFGQVMDQALAEDELVVERYGEPCVAILSYQRYQQLLHIEAQTLRPYVIAPDNEVAAIEQGIRLAAQIRQELSTTMKGTLDGTMAKLRGRS